MRFLLTSLAVFLLPIVTAATCESMKRATDFTPAKFIWTSEMSGGTAASTPRAFRVPVPTVEGAKPEYGHFIFKGDDGISLWVNGKELGKTSGWMQPSQFAVKFDPKCPNGVAVTGHNSGGGPAFFIGVGEITYSDGSTRQILTDTTWKTIRAPAPPGFADPGFDTSTWEPTIVVANNPAKGLGPTAKIDCVDTSYDCIPDGPVNSCGDHRQSKEFEPAQWISTIEMASGSIPKGPRIFRKVFPSPPGKTAIAADILVAVDDNLDFFVNGEKIDSFTTTEKRHAVILNPCLNVFAARDTNGGNVEAWIAKITITYSDGTNSTVITDASWRASGKDIPAGFEKVDFDEAGLGMAYAVKDVALFANMPPAPPRLTDASACKGSPSPCPYCSG